MDFLAKDGTNWINVLPGPYKLVFLQLHVAVRCTVAVEPSDRECTACTSW